MSDLNDALELLAHATERNRRLNEVLAETDRTIARLTAPFMVLAAGYHPFEGGGYRLVERVLAEYEEGTITLGGITQDLVWRYAEEAGLSPDFKPVFPMADAET